MRRLTQLAANGLLYAFLLWLLYDSTIGAWDPWFAFVVAFVLLLAVLVSLVPALHARETSPGRYPFQD